jgi:methionyl-tRNA formyltransferase
VRTLILATRNNPYSYFAMQELNASSIDVFGIALDSKENPSTVAIWTERTGGRMPAGDLQEFETKDSPFFNFDSHAGDDFQAFITDNDIDLLVNAGTPRILKQDLLDTPNIGVLNVHPSILPKYRGCTTTEWSIYNDDPIGNTAHFMTTGIDEGPIIDQGTVALAKTDQYEDMRTKIYKANVQLMARVLQRIQAENITPETLECQVDGKYWPVMDQDKLNQVRQKLKDGAYKYQS